jgi:DNA-binding GntR family transcriptional regulator
MAGRTLGPASAEIAALEAAARATDDALTRKDLDSWATADEQFHRLLLEHCGNQRLRRMALAVWDQSHRARILTLRLRPWPAESVVEHWATLNAIRRGDSRAAFEIHRAHRMRGMNLILDLLERHGLWQL